MNASPEDMDIEEKDEEEKPKKAKKLKPPGADGHRERMYMRILNDDVGSMEDYHILETLLFFAIPVKDTRDTAYELVKRFGSLRGVINADFSELIRVDGVGKRSATLIKVVAAIIKSINLRTVNKNRHVQIRSPQQLGQLFTRMAETESKEVLCAAVLDQSNRLINIGCIQCGDMKVTPLCMRAIVDFVVTNNASSIAIAHNHPSGNLHPSAEDIVFTKALKNSLQSLDIRLIEHVIVSEDKYLLMLDSGIV